MRRVGLALTLAGTCVVAGCGWNSVGTTGNKTHSPEATDPDITLRYEAGVIDGDVEHAFQIPWTNRRVVESVTKGCGCTAVTVNAGDALTAGAVIGMRVSTAGKT